MQLVVPLAAEAAGATVTIDGVTYQALQTNGSGALVVAATAPLFTPTSVTDNHKAVTTAGTRVQLQTQACKAVSIKALAANTGKIYVGDSSVSSSNGYELSAGDSIDLAIDNVNRLYIDSSVNGEGVSWLAVA